MATKGNKKVTLKQCHPCGTPVLVKGFGLVKCGETIMASEGVAKALLEGKIWCLEKEAPKKTK